ncbi:hypothetical protein [Bartonella tamiae]|nr:hypothetical protein [Bartonella tamiae]
MMNRRYRMALCLLLTAFLSACSTLEKQDEINSDLATTGYWYLGDNGQRQWRTLSPSQITTETPVVQKNYASPVGSNM